MDTEPHRLMRTLAAAVVLGLLVATVDPPPSYAPAPAIAIDRAPHPADRARTITRTPLPTPGGHP